MRVGLPHFSRLSALLLALLPLTVEAKSTFHYELEPVRLHFTTNHQVYASYAEPCGSRFAGFLYRPGVKGELQVAAVVERFHARCLGLSGMKEVKLPLVSALRFGALSSINPTLEPQTVSSVSIQNVHTEQSKKWTGIHAIYTSQCGKPLGLIVREEANGLHFGMLESSPSREVKASCNRSTEVYSLPNLDIALVQSPQFIKEISEKTSTSPYSLRRVPVRLQRLRESSSKPSQSHERYFHLSYLRACDEAPVGLVRQQRGRTMEISMLVARFPSMSCEAQSPQKTWTSWSEKVLLGAGQEFKTVQKASSEDLRIIRPSSYTFGKGHKISVKAFSSCNQNLGVISRSSSEGVAIGILQSTRAQPCNSPLKQVKYLLPLDPGKEVRPDIKPLLLVGQL